MAEEQERGKPPAAGVSPADDGRGERLRDLEVLQQEVEKRIRDNQRFLERFMDVDFDEEDDSEEGEEEIFEEL